MVLTVRQFLNQRGAVSYKTLFWILVLFSVVYVGYKFVPPTVSYYMLKTDVEEEAKLAHVYNDRKLAERILKKASAWSVPIREEDIIIKRGLEKISISIRYTEKVNLFNQYTKVLHYNIVVEKPLKETSTILH